MEKKIKFEAFISDVGKTAKTLLDNAVQVADQNDDGKFDFSDISAIAENISDKVKAGTEKVKDSVDEKSKELELKTLRPIFADTLNDLEFSMPKFIRVVNRDKKYVEKEVCQGSIGYHSEQKGLPIVNIFRDSVESFGLLFYPDSDCEFYYVDPSDKNKYIALDEYFSYLKVARINELQKIAQDLGAKYFRVTYKEEQTSFTKKQVKANVKKVADVEHTSDKKKYSRVEIAAEMTFPGHAPVEPTLKYLQSDTSIQNLVSMRMDATGPVLHQEFMLQLSNSSGMKESDAVKIDTVLKSLKYVGNATVASEAKNESRRYLEYKIEF